MGGGPSHGALFFGSARYGTVADNTLGLEVATTDGAPLRTGQRGVMCLRPDRSDLSLHGSPWPGPAVLLRRVKTQPDPRRHMNPGVLGLQVAARCPPIAAERPASRQGSQPSKPEAARCQASHSNVFPCPAAVPRKSPNKYF